MEPPPGLAALDTLAERHRGSGLDVTMRVDGARRQLRRAMDQAAYRILQEALTNAARHGARQRRASRSRTGRALEVDVTNPVGPRRARRGGNGLVGMRERAALLGGSLETGARDGAFRVRALLPYGEAV